MRVALALIVGVMALATISGCIDRTEEIKLAKEMSAKGKATKNGIRSEINSISGLGSATLSQRHLDRPDLWITATASGPITEEKAKAFGDAMLRAGIRHLEGQIYTGSPPKTRYGYHILVRRGGGLPTVQGYKRSTLNWITW